MKSGKARKQRYLASVCGVVGSRIMGLGLTSGGHLTHGHYTAQRAVSATSLYFESLPYEVRALFMWGGDVGIFLEFVLGQIKSDLLKVSHCQSATSSSGGFWLCFPLTWTINIPVAYTHVAAFLEIYKIGRFSVRVNNCKIFES